MSQDYCRGCGTILQTQDPNAPGYLPEATLDKGSKLICQRCYRIAHYGQVGTVTPEPGKIKEVIAKAIAQSQLVVLVADFSDLTGTIPAWAGLLKGKSYLLALNKSDLLPSRTPEREISEYLHTYLQRYHLDPPKDLILVSAAKGRGLTILEKRIQIETAPQTKIALLGAANVGKSSLIKRFLAAEGSPTTPTVSKFPGTTIGLSNWQLFKGRNTLVDTPGLVPGDRLLDRLCPRCAANFNTTANLETKLLGLQTDQGVILGGVTGVEFKAVTAKSAVIVYTPRGLGIHRTNNAKIAGLLDEHPNWLGDLCQGCCQRITWHQETLQIDSNQDLAIAGLGWLSTRNLTTEITLRLPRGVRYELRPALIGKR